jgi:cyclopropane-fatty-acyl-phospholipid synthase
VHRRGRRRAHLTTYDPRTADRKDIDFSYTLTDRVIRLALGEVNDFSGAKYDGDFSLTLAQAQRRKHEFVAEQVGIGPGKRVLDLGCGWGGMLDHIREVGAEGVGVTLSSAQVESCRKHGFDVHLFDARDLTPEAFGRFDAVVSMGAFEHFCSPDDYDAGRQDDVYRNVFERVASVLPHRGRFYLQTMVFGRNMIPPEDVSRDAPRDSDAWYLAMMRAAFPGSWLPFGRGGVTRCAEPWFELIESQSGRLDYMQTIREWDERTEGWSPRMALLKLRLLPRWLTDSNFRFAFTSGASSNLICFERELLDHWRLVLEKR